MSDENGILKNCTAYGRRIQRCWTACWRYLTPQRCFSAIWYLLMVVVGIEAFQRLAARKPQGIWNWVQTFAAGAIVFLLFVFVRQLFRTSGGKRRQAGAEQQETAASANSGAYPSPATKLVAFILLATSAFSLVGLFLAMNPPTWPDWLDWLTKFMMPNSDKADQVNEALVMLFSAGIGSSIQTIRSYTLHASEQKDFDAAFVPWYIARPLLGMLLGLVFYCLIKGGLLAVQLNATAANQDLNVYSLAGIGALVGLFSHRAIDKLGEVFSTLFRTENEWQRQLAMLTGETRDKLIGVLPDEIRTKVMFGSEADVAKALEALSAAEKKSLLEKLPALVKPLFEKNLQYTPGDVLFDGIKQLSPVDKTKLLKQLGAEAGAVLLDQGGDALDTWLKTKLPEAKKAELRGLAEDEMPQTVKKILEPYLKPPEPAETKPETNPPPEMETAES